MAAPERNRSQAVLETSPEPRYRLYRLCDCDACAGTGKDPDQPFRKCLVCRGEGRQRERIAECESPEALGLAIVTLGREGEFDECPIGILDIQGEVGRKWLVRPWKASPREVSAAGRVLRSARKEGAA